MRTNLLRDKHDAQTHNLLNSESLKWKRIHDQTPYIFTVSIKIFFKESQIESSIKISRHFLSHCWLRWFLCRCQTGKLQLVNMDCHGVYEKWIHLHGVAVCCGFFSMWEVEDHDTGLCHKSHSRINKVSICRAVSKVFNLEIVGGKLAGQNWSFKSLWLIFVEYHKSNVYVPKRNSTTDLKNEFHRVIGQMVQLFATTPLKIL